MLGQDLSVLVTSAKNGGSVDLLTISNSCNSTRIKNPSKVNSYFVPPLAMMFSSKLISAFLVSFALSFVTAEEAEPRRLSGKAFVKGPRSGKITLKVTNLSWQQPFGGVFVMTHKKKVDPLFVLGEPSTDELAILAENGDPGPLVELYKDQKGVGSVFAFTEGAPYGGNVNPENPNNTFFIEIDYDRKYPFISLATMAINTNDCFVAINGRKLKVGDVFTGVGYDSGSEVNNEMCNSIPGPACPMGSGNERSGGGEGFVHVHRGFFGINAAMGGLTAAGYDWRNPMVRFEVMEAEYY